MPDYDFYQSPFSWRYATEEMRRLWSEKEKRLTWRKIWVSLARVQSAYGLVTEEQLSDLEQNASRVDIETALAIEAEIHHDLMAELKTFAGQSPIGGGILHLGATSMDIEDNADAMRLRAALDLVIARLVDLLKLLVEKMLTYAGLPIIAFTHLQPAEPSTLGYRLSMYAQDLAADLEQLRQVRSSIRGKGFKGAVGTAAAYAELIGVDRIPEFEEQLSRELDLPFFPVSTQTYPRRQDYTVISALAALAGSIYKFAFDLRLLQSPTIGELSEPFAERQVGSSAMPFKRNPINAEKINSLARSLAQMPPLAWHNAAHSLLERTLDDSANRRTLLPEAFLTADELLKTTNRILRGLKVNQSAIAQNLAIYAPFASTERVLMALVKAGADRQEIHELLREHAMAAWSEVRSGQPNPLQTLVVNDPNLTRFIPPDKIQALMQVDSYTGIAPQRTRELAAHIQAML